MSRAGQCDGRSFELRRKRKFQQLIKKKNLDKDLVEKIYNCKDTLSIFCVIYFLNKNTDDTYS